VDCARRLSLPEYSIRERHFSRYLLENRQRQSNRNRIGLTAGRVVRYRLDGRFRHNRNGESDERT
jgi:hypothetical protein